MYLNIIFLLLFPLLQQECLKILDGGISENGLPSKFCSEPFQTPSKHSKSSFDETQSAVKMAKRSLNTSINSDSSSDYKQKLDLEGTLHTENEDEDDSGRSYVLIL